MHTEGFLSQNLLVTGAAPQILLGSLQHIPRSHHMLGPMGLIFGSRASRLSCLLPHDLLCDLIDPEMAVSLDILALPLSTCIYFRTCV